ncbi:MAG: GyrI-like domain-containing protein, partial [Bacteroidota bacterium]
AFKTFHHIFNEWIPNSEFNIDQRPHFEIMPEGYKADDPNAMEEVWIPIIKKLE